MTSLTYQIYRLASALRHHVPRQLTPGGILVFAGLILTASVSFDLDRTVAYQAVALIFCLLLTAAGFKPFFRGRFQAVRHLPRFASAGHPFRYRVEVRNGTRRTFPHLELFEDLADPRPNRAEFTEWFRSTGAIRSFRLRRSAVSTRSARFPNRDFRRATIASVPLPPLPSGATREVVLEARPLRRGPLRFDGLSIARTDPLGLIRGFRRLPLPESVLVLPKRYPLPGLVLGGNRQYQRGGVTLAASLGDSEEFVSLRDYRPGDPRRHIHWRSWARTGRPIVREYQDEFVPRHALILDTFVPTAHHDAFEEAVSIAASFACTLDTQESLLDLLFVGSQAICFTTGRGLGQPEQALEILAAVQRNPSASFDTLTQLVRRHASLVCGCVCVWVGWDAPRRALVRTLRELGLPVINLVVATDAPTANSVSAEMPEPGVHFLQPGRIAEGLRRLEAAS